MRFLLILLGMLALQSCSMTAAGEKPWLDEIAGNYYGGPPLSVCQTAENPPHRCNCLSIKKLSDTSAAVTFDRHDQKKGYACVGYAVAKVVGKSLVFCPEKAGKKACVTIQGDADRLSFHSENGGADYCGTKASLRGMTFLYSDRVTEAVNCGP